MWCLGVRTPWDPEAPCSQLHLHPLIPRLSGFGIRNAFSTYGDFAAYGTRAGDAPLGEQPRARRGVESNVFSAREHASFASIIHAQTGVEVNVFYLYERNAPLINRVLGVERDESAKLRGH